LKAPNPFVCHGFSILHQSICAAASAGEESFANRSVSVTAPNGKAATASNGKAATAPNGNQSQLHLDIVCIQTKAYGGGEIWFDGECIRRDGFFLPASLQGLNKGLKG